MNTLLDKPIIRLLLVDDDQFDRMACKRALVQNQDCEFVLFEADTANQGLNIARSEQLDCILLWGDRMYFTLISTDISI